MSKLPDTLNLNIQMLEDAQVLRLAADLTAQYGVFGKRYTPVQVRAALWQSLNNLIDSQLHDLEMLTANDHAFEDHLGAPETWNDPQAELCAVCGHMQGHHIADEGCECIVEDANAMVVCGCRAFVPTVENSVDPETRERAILIYRANQGNIPFADCIVMAI